MQKKALVRKENAICDKMLNFSTSLFFPFFHASAFLFSCTLLLKTTKSAIDASSATSALFLAFLGYQNHLVVHSYRVRKRNTASFKKTSRTNPQQKSFPFCIKRSLAPLYPSLSLSLFSPLFPHDTSKHYALFFSAFDNFLITCNPHTNA
ncbi:Uncharacterised protein [Candidatus Bartonella washoeensis]|uniref:Uncharacterized protein n=1 Tax=Candidatus Bartonella washoeensis Sb944nv TaxID=1094563 RepID=J1J845_9HYPH|nr:hypothetical protein MCQ_00538 [Bartonella washoeensis Sb944nv]SPU26110.1 Uncharacterised protein [Bartonella washoeensis]